MVSSSIQHGTNLCWAARWVVQRYPELLMIIRAAQGANAAMINCFTVPGELFTLIRT